MSTHFFAYNRLDYAQNMMEFLARAYESKEVYPDVWYRLVAGEFAVTRSNIPFTTVGADHAQEQTNRDLKGGGGLQGITNKPATLLKYCLTVPVLSQISKQTEVMLRLSMAGNESYHHHLSEPRIKKQESAIAAIKDVLGPLKVFN